MTTFTSICGGRAWKEGEDEEEGRGEGGEERRGKREVAEGRVRDPETVVKP